MFQIPQAARPAPRQPAQTVQPVGSRQIGTLQPAPARSGQTAATIQPIVTRPPSDTPFMGAGGSTNARAVAPDFDQFRDFGDIIMQEYQRTTAPEIEARRARMNQDLVNRGFSPGSEAYEREMDRFMRMENDAFGVAQRNAVQQGLAAQDQMMQQGLAQAGINANLRNAALQAQTSRFNTRYSADRSLDGLMAQLAQADRHFDVNDQFRNRTFDVDDAFRNRVQDDAVNQNDFGNLMNLLGFGSAITQQNNNAFWNDRNAATGVGFSGVPSAPIIPINAGGAFGTALQGQNAAAGLQQRQNDGFWGAIGGVGSSLLPFLSDRNMKENLEHIENDEILERLRAMPVYRWQYKNQDQRHLGPMAQDFGALVNDDPEAKTISGIDAIGALIASVQALADRVDELERPDDLHSYRIEDAAHAA